MKLAMIASAAVAAVIGLAAASQASAFTVLGTDDIFAAGLVSSPASTMGGGTLPGFVTVAPGESLTITATGTVDCCLGSTTPGTGPDGFSSSPNGNPFGLTGSTITNSTTSSIGGFSNNVAFPLVATYTDSTGKGIGTVFAVGSSDTDVIVPTGASRLYFGLADASGFNGPSGYYNDNGGSFSVSVSGAPEPASWALMIVGVGLAGAALRRKSQGAMTAAVA